MANHQIITFYSYKGGTGRSMSMANVAVHMSLPPHSKRVLVIDWDLEAPGQNFYFYKQIKEKYSKGSNARDNFDIHPGILDLFEDVEQRIKRKILEKQIVINAVEAFDDPVYESEAFEIVDKIDVSRYVIQTSLENIDIIKAGSFDENYPERVNKFDWENLFNSAPHIFNAVGRKLATSGNYDYVLIDSRTGMTDSAGVCTRLMPDKVVVVFTANRQSLFGVSELVKRAVKFRWNSNDLRPLNVFPLVSRIEPNEEHLWNLWRHGSEEPKIMGYQPAFEDLFEKVYRKDKGSCGLDAYFNEILIQQVSSKSYGENISINPEIHSDERALFSRYSSLARTLIDYNAPWEFGVDLEKEERSKTNYLVEINPYPGSVAFSRDNADVYIAKGNMDEVVISYLKTECAAVVVHGSPGTGKTSYLNCVLLDSLKQSFSDSEILQIDCKDISSVSQRSVANLIVVSDHFESDKDSIDNIFKLFKIGDENTKFLIFTQSQHVEKVQKKLSEYSKNVQLCSISDYIELDREYLKKIVATPARLGGVLIQQEVLANVEDIIFESGQNKVPLDRLALIQRICRILWSTRRGGWIANTPHSSTEGLKKILFDQNRKTFNRRDPVSRKSTLLPVLQFLERYREEDDGDKFEYREIDSDAFYGNIYDHSLYDLSLVEFIENTSLVWSSAENEKKVVLGDQRLAKVILLEQHNVKEDYKFLTTLRRKYNLWNRSRRNSLFLTKEQLAYHDNDFNERRLSLLNDESEFVELSKQHLDERWKRKLGLWVIGVFCSVLVIGTILFSLIGLRNSAQTKVIRDHSELVRDAIARTNRISGEEIAFARALDIYAGLNEIKMLEDSVVSRNIDPSISAALDSYESYLQENDSALIKLTNIDTSDIETNGIVRIYILEDVSVGTYKYGRTRSYRLRGESYNIKSGTRESTELFDPKHFESSMEIPQAMLGTKNEILVGGFRGELVVFEMEDNELKEKYNEKLLDEMIVKIRSTNLGGTYVLQVGVDGFYKLETYSDHKINNGELLRLSSIDLRKGFNSEEDILAEWDWLVLELLYDKNSDQIIIQTSGAGYYVLDANNMEIERLDIDANTKLFTWNGPGTGNLYLADQGKPLVYRIYDNKKLKIPTDYEIASLGHFNNLSNDVFYSVEYTAVDTIGSPPDDKVRWDWFLRIWELDDDLSSVSMVDEKSLNYFDTLRPPTDYLETIVSTYNQFLYILNKDTGVLHIQEFESEYEAKGEIKIKTNGGELVYYKLHNQLQVSSMDVAPNGIFTVSQAINGGSQVWKIESGVKQMFLPIREYENVLNSKLLFADNTEELDGAVKIFLQYANTTGFGDADLSSEDLKKRICDSDAVKYLVEKIKDEQLESKPYDYTYLTNLQVGIDCSFK